MKNKNPAFGIDLGTTYSAIACIDDTGNPSIIPNRDGENSTPSVIFFEGKNVIVGSMAQESSLREPRNTARMIKRYMGLPGARFVFSNKIMDPEILSAFILKKLAQDAERGLQLESGGVRDVVITVPAYFTDIQRKATADAGRIAGLNVLSVINEPVAAALYYSLDRLQSDDAILVYDLGGGTFDLTLLRIQNGVVRMIATDGTARLGGYDWTLALANLVCDQFVRQYDSDPREDLDSLQYVMDNTEKAKRLLSARDRVVITISHEGNTMKIAVTRDEFESCAAHLLEQTSSVIKLCFQRRKIPFSEVNRIILVGGATRMPMILKLIGKYFPDCPVEQINPDDCVALGAAVYADLLLGDETGKNPSLSQRLRAEMICPHSLGVEAIQKDSRRVNAILIPRETPIPAERSRVFFTSKDGQTSVKINILEGETEDPEGCVSVGCCVIDGLPPAPQKENEIEVTFHYNEQGRILVSAIHKRSGRSTSAHIERNAGIPDKSLNDAIENFNKFRVE